MTRDKEGLTVHSRWLVCAFDDFLIAQTAMDTVVANQIVKDDLGLPTAVAAHTSRSDAGATECRATNAVVPILHWLLPSHQTNFWSGGPLLKLHLTDGAISAGQWGKWKQGRETLLF